MYYNKRKMDFPHAPDAEAQRGRLSFYLIKFRGFYVEVKSSDFPVRTYPNFIGTSSKYHFEFT
jgi:hypothetical protein